MKVGGLNQQRPHAHSEMRLAKDVQMFAWNDLITQYQIQLRIVEHEQMVFTLILRRQTAQAEIAPVAYATSVIEPPESTLTPNQTLEIQRHASVDQASIQIPPMISEVNEPTFDAYAATKMKERALLAILMRHQMENLQTHAAVIRDFILVIIVVCNVMRHVPHVQAELLQIAPLETQITFKVPPTLRTASLLDRMDTINLALITLPFVGNVSLLAQHVMGPLRMIESHELLLAQNPMAILAANVNAVKGRLITIQTTLRQTTVFLVIKIDQLVHHTFFVSSVMMKMPHQHQKLLPLKVCEFVIHSSIIPRRMKKLYVLRAM